VETQRSEGMLMSSVNRSSVRTSNRVYVWIVWCPCVHKHHWFKCFPM